MPAALDASTAARLAKICGLFSSDHAGERSAAAWKAHELVQAAGLDWHDVLVVRLPAPEPPRPDPAMPPHSALARAVLRFADRLTIREREFLADISRCRRITSKQQDWLDAIAAKVHARSAA